MQSLIQVKVLVLYHVLHLHRIEIVRDTVDTHGLQLRSFAYCILFHAYSCIKSYRIRDMYEDKEIFTLVKNFDYIQVKSPTLVKNLDQILNS